MNDFPELTKIASLASAMGDVAKFYRKYDSTYDHLEKAVDPESASNKDVMNRNRVAMRTKGAIPCRPSRSI